MQNTNKYETFYIGKRGDVEDENEEVLSLGATDMLKHLSDFNDKYLALYALINRSRMIKQGKISFV